MNDKSILVVKNIKNFRTKLIKKKVEDIAKLLNKKESTIRCYETEAEIIPLKYLIILANELDLSLDYLFGLTNENIKYFKITLTLKELGENLRKERKKLNKTLNNVSEKTQISKSSLSKYERGKNEIKTLYLSILVKEYKIKSIDELFNRKIVK